MSLNLKVLACHTRIHCKDCRTDPDWTEKILGVREFECPYGITIENLKEENILPSVPRCLVGSELKKLLSYLNIESKEDCKCNDRSRIMDDMGCDWCINNKDKIVDWMKEAAEKRSLPFNRFIAKRIVELAIYKAKKKYWKNI